MQQIIHKIAAIFLAIVVLFSTMSFTMQKLYCKGNLVETAVFSKINHCEIEGENNCYVASESCCNFENVVIDGQSELQFHSTKISLIHKQYFIKNELVTYKNRFVTHNKKQVLSSAYFPPNLIKDRQIIHQVFII